MIKSNKKAARWSLILLLSFYYTLLLPSCKNYRRNTTHAHVSLSSIENGEALAKVYCQSCHMLPEPALLDAKSWEEGVLPEMGPRLGIFSYGFEMYPKVKDKTISTGFYPSHPVLNVFEWQNIIDYYGATSPDSLPAQKRNEAIKTGLLLFKVEVPPAFYSGAATCYVKINAGDTTHPIIISDAVKQNIYFFDRHLQVSDSINKTGPVVDIDFRKSDLLACNIGVLNPNNGRFGKGVLINKNAQGRYQRDSTSFIDSLQRPVQVTTVDLDNDRKADYLVCEFGYLTGALSWMENTGNNHFLKHVIKDAPGAIKAYVRDYNHDGLPDIWALFAQGDEGVFLFTNKGNGNFDQQKVLGFPPSYGSSYFELDDFNNDGYPDIVYTCGDNADYSPVLKPYHGVYIFLNDKTNHFIQKYFFPINGCYKAIARDYDGGGDLDIAAISFFADYERQPEESFVYLKNIGDFTFQPHSMPGAGIGRWLTMDAGDIDGDGKTDLILGNFSVGPTKMRHTVDWKNSPPFIVLKNIRK